MQAAEVHVARAQPLADQQPLLRVALSCGRDPAEIRIIAVSKEEPVETIGEGLAEAGIRYWHTFLNGTAGRSHSREHAINSAKVFNQTNPMLVGTGGLTLFPGTPLLDEAERGEFDSLTERELLEELLLFVENLECDCTFVTHHTVGGENLTGPNFLERKDRIVASLHEEIEHGDLDIMARMRAMKTTL